MADFIISFIAIVPLAGLLGEATEQVALKVGSTLGGLLNATFGNAVEAIVKPTTDRTDLNARFDSIEHTFSVRMFIHSGRFQVQRSRFQATAAQASASLMLLACIALVIPAAYFSSSLEKINSGRQHPAVPSGQDLAHGLALGIHAVAHEQSGKELAQHGLLVISRGTSVHALIPIRGYVNRIGRRGAKMNFRTATGALIGVTVVTAFCAEYLVDSIDEFASTAGIPKAFIGLILLLSSGKMELAIGVAVGSSIQIAVGVIPIMVIIGWATGKELTLFFENFETICLVFSVLLTTLLIQDGKSNYMEGAMLVSLYVIIGLAFWVS
ncbi:hypothetical protein H4Q26_005969 [Puccinia striiformis f. sp. tritici PST-130]|nr:hypothetical protein H4Q26_005969 [Puccinia striiformis f. sp. tritici PST-130]